MKRIAFATLTLLFIAVIVCAGVKPDDGEYELRFNGSPEWWPLDIEQSGEVMKYPAGPYAIDWLRDENGVYWALTHSGWLKSTELHEDGTFTKTMVKLDPDGVPIPGTWEVKTGMWRKKAA